MTKKKIIERNGFKTVIEQFIDNECKLDDYHDEFGEAILDDEISDWVDEYMRKADIEIVVLDGDTIRINAVSDEVLNEVRLLLEWVRRISNNSVYATSALQLSEPKMISSVITKEGSLLIHLISDLYE